MRKSMPTKFNRDGSILAGKYDDCRVQKQGKRQDNESGLQGRLHRLRNMRQTGQRVIHHREQSVAIGLCEISAERKDADCDG